MNPSDWTKRQTRIILISLMIVGVVFLYYYLSWWFVHIRLHLPGLPFLLVGAVAYSLVQLVGNWIIQFAAGVHQHSKPDLNPEKFTIDVFLTTNGEDFGLVTRALSAVVAMKLPHRTWLLDDGDDPHLARLAEQLEAGYLTRAGNTNAKAGNLNAALARTDGDIIAIFDVDHAPLPNFLEESVGHFSDEEVGFVQVMLTFEGEKQRKVASAAADSSLDFYNAVSVGSDALGGTTLIGSNAIIRRKALESIGGYQPGLAEDLATSLALHGAGWKSVYVHEPLAPGHAPPDLSAWFTQQTKWARGVFEVLLTAYPKVFLSLTWRQRLIYAVRMTYYWIGLVVAAHLLMTITVLFVGSEGALITFEGYLRRLLPLAATTVGIRYFALKQTGHESLTPGNPLRALSLIYLSWPIYMLAWCLAVCRIPIRFRPTPKSAGDGIPLIWLFPQAIVFVILLIGLVISLPLLIELPTMFTLSFVVAQLIGQLLPFFFLEAKDVDNSFILTTSGLFSQLTRKLSRANIRKAK